LDINKKAVRTLFGGVIGCIVVYWLLHETERLKVAVAWITNLFAPFVLGAALAFILNVPMRAIERSILKGMKQSGGRRALALVLTFVAIFLVLALVVLLLIPQIDATVESLVAELPGFFQRSEKLAREFLAEHPELLQWLRNNTELENFDWMAIIQKAATLAGNGVTTIVNGAISAVGTVFSALVTAIIGLVFALYCLGRKEVLARQGRRLLYSLLREPIADEIVRILRLTNSTFSNFISGQCLEAVILGLMFAVCMSIFGMPYMPLVSVLIAVTALVPIVGAFVGCIVGALFILVDSPILAVWFVVMFLVLQQIEGNLIYPKVVGNSIGLPGMWVLMAVTIGGEVMGIAGMLLMIPLASVLYALLREFTDFQLKRRGVDPEKLQDQPPELKSKFREKRQKAKENRLLRRLKRKKKS